MKPRLTNSRTSFSPKLSVGRIRTDGSRGIDPRLPLVLPLLATPTVPVRNRNDDQQQDLKDYEVTGLAASNINWLPK